MPSTEWVHSLKVVELKDECKKRGLPVGGKKAELIERLEAYIAENEKSPEEAAAAEEQPAEEQAAEEQPAEADEPVAEEEEPESAAAEEAAPEAEEAAPAAAEEPEEQEQQAPEQPAEEPAAAEQQPAAMEAEEAPAAEEPAAAEAGSAEPAAAAPEPAAAAEEQPAAMEEDQPAEPAAEEAAAAEQPPKQPQQQEQQQQQQQPDLRQQLNAARATAAAPAADVDLDYGEDSEGEEEQEQQGAAKAEEAPKRKREESPAAAAPPARRASGAAGRGAAADRALAAVASQSAGGSAERPSKVPRSSSGFSMSGAAEKGEAPAPEEVPEAQKPATRALRIDGFVRPFTERQVRELLSETGAVVALWMPTIKTHAYCVFESKEQAEATRRATYQLQWPATNPKRLAPKFVPLSEAETAIGNGAGNPDFRVRRVDGDEDEPAAPAAPVAAAAAPAAKEGKKAAAAEDKPAAVVDRSQREWNRNRRSPSPPLEGVRDLREMLSRKASMGSARSGEAAPVGAAGDRGRPSEREREPQLPPGLGRPAPERRDADRRDRRREEHPVLTLDELFKKTSAKPCIYWLPLTDQQVADKKRKAAEEAAAKAAAPKDGQKENGSGAPAAS